ncbi:hypothetical protein SAMN04487939_1397 [Lysobacter sp. yr284]|nr:hypothetical protein SAMN04487939_1397 [Lysobacter sp. yr284]
MPQTASPEGAHRRPWFRRKAECFLILPLPLPLPLLGPFPLL